MICSSLNRFFTSNLLSGRIDSKASCYSKSGGRRSGYKALFERGEIEIGCMAHARRKFHSSKTKVQQTTG
jgi:hypothetical protein